MVIDTSALVAILQDEPERRAFNEAIEAAERRAMSAASFVEVSMVIEASPDCVPDRAGVLHIAHETHVPSGLVAKSQPVGTFDSTIQVLSGRMPPFFFFLFPL